MFSVITMAVGSVRKSREIIYKQLSTYSIEKSTIKCNKSQVLCRLTIKMNFYTRYDCIKLPNELLTSTMLEMRAFMGFV